MVELDRRRANALLQFDDRDLGAGADLDQRARDDRGLARAGAEREQYQRLVERGPGRDLDHDAVLRKGRIQHQRAVVTGHFGQSERGRDLVRSFGQRLGQAAGGDAGRQALQIGISRAEHAVNCDEAPAGDGLQRQPVGDRLRSRRATRQRHRLAHQVAQIGIAPGSEPAMRQALGLEAGEGILAQLAHRAGARQFGLDVGELLGELLLGRGLEWGDERHYAASP